MEVLKLLVSSHQWPRDGDIVPQLLSEREQLAETTPRIYIKQKVKNGRKERKWKGRDFEFQLPFLLRGYITLNTPINLPELLHL